MLFYIAPPLYYYKVHLDLPEDNAVEYFTAEEEAKTVFQHLGFVYISVVLPLLHHFSLLGIHNNKNSHRMWIVDGGDGVQLLINARVVSSLLCL